MTKTLTNSGSLVIFGITGDLTRRYLLPALYNLAKDDLLPEHFEIIGITRRGITVDQLLANLKVEVEKRQGDCDSVALKRLGEIMRVVTMDMGQLADYKTLKADLDASEDEHGVCLNRLFYLSIPPQVFGPVVDFLGEAGLADGCQHGMADSRIMVEKPFGYDLTSAQELVERLQHSFKEEQIYRIDHYLAKETAQNILTFRFANPIFTAVWDNRLIERITISASESIGIEKRATFYESTGALRDFIQNHLLQLLAIVTMEEPSAMTAANIHAEKLKLMQSITAIAPNEVANKTTRGQYQGYRDEVSTPNSITETFARVELTIDNDHWRNVPVVLQTGKHLDQKTTAVTLGIANPHEKTTNNSLVFRLQPNEGITLDLLAKKPGLDNQTEHVEMAFNYAHDTGESVHPDAYERVLMDGIRGDQTLFTSSAEVLESWRIVDSIVQEWSKGGNDLIIYDPGATPEQISR